MRYSSLAEVFFLTRVQPVVGSGDGSALSFSEALHPDPVALLDLHLLGLNAAQHFGLLALHLHAHLLLVGKVLSLEQVDLAAPIFPSLATLHLVDCYHLPFLLQAPVLRLQAADVAHQVADPDFDLAVAAPHMLQLTDQIAVAPDLDRSQLQRADLFADPGIDGLPLAAKRLQLKHEFLPVGEQIFLLHGQRAYLPDLLFVLQDQLQQNLALLPQLTRLVDALGLTEIRAHQPAEQLFRVDGSFLI